MTYMYILLHTATEIQKVCQIHTRFVSSTISVFVRMFVSPHALRVVGGPLGTMHAGSIAPLGLGATTQVPFTHICTRYMCVYVCGICVYVCGMYVYMYVVSAYCS